MKIDNSVAMMNANQNMNINKNVDDKALKQQTDQFESLIIKMLLDTSMKDENTLFGKDPGNKIYQSMFRNEISKVSSGSFGFSQMLFDHLKKENVKIP